MLVLEKVTFMFFIKFASASLEMDSYKTHKCCLLTQMYVEEKPGERNCTYVSKIGSQNRGIKS